MWGQFTGEPSEYSGYGLGRLLLPRLWCWAILHCLPGGCPNGCLEPIFPGLWCLGYCKRLGSPTALHPQTFPASQNSLILPATQSPSWGEGSLAAELIHVTSMRRGSGSLPAPTLPRDFIQFFWEIWVMLSVHLCPSTLGCCSANKCCCSQLLPRWGPAGWAAAGKGLSVPWPALPLAVAVCPDCARGRGNYRIIEWFGWVETLKLISFHCMTWAETFSARPGCYKPHQAGLEHFQEMAG